MDKEEQLNKDLLRELDGYPKKVPKMKETKKEAGQSGSVKLEYADPSSSHQTSPESPKKFPS